MSRCVFCGDPIGPGGSMRLYHSEPSGRDGYACAACEKRLRAGFGGATVSSEPQENSPAAAPPWSRGGQPLSLGQPPSLGHSSVSPPQAATPPSGPSEIRSSPLAEPAAPPSSPPSPEDPWLFTLRILVVVIFCAMCVGGVCLAVYAQYSLDPSVGQGSVGPLFYLVLAGVLLAAFFFAGVVMVFLGIARDVRRIRMVLTRDKK